MRTRIRVVLACAECGARNYRTSKARPDAGTTDLKRLEAKKFCSHCGRHTLHQESK